MLEPTHNRILYKPPDQLTLTGATAAKVRKAMTAHLAEAQPLTPSVTPESKPAGGTIAANIRRA